MGFCVVQGDAWHCLSYSSEAHKSAPCPDGMTSMVWLESRVDPVEPQESSAASSTTVAPGPALRCDLCHATASADRRELEHTYTTKCSVLLLGHKRCLSAVLPQLNPILLREAPLHSLYLSLRNWSGDTMGILQEDQEQLGCAASWAGLLRMLCHCSTKLAGAPVGRNCVPGHTPCV